MANQEENLENGIHSDQNSGKSHSEPVNTNDDSEQFLNTLITSSSVVPPVTYSSPGFTSDMTVRRLPANVCGVFEASGSGVTSQHGLGLTNDCSLAHQQSKTETEYLLEQDLLLEEDELRLKRKRIALAKLINAGETHKETPLIVKDKHPVIDRSQHTESSSLEELLSRLIVSSSLPKIEIEPFSGAPEEFATFLSTFHSQVGSQIADPYQKLCHLIYYCKGVAKEAIKHCVLLPTERCFATAIEILKSQFGRPHQIIQAVTQNLFTGPPIRSNDLGSLQSLLRQMRSSAITLSQLGREADLNCGTNLLRIVKRLPKSIQGKWAEVVDSLLSNGKEPTFGDLLSLVERRVSIASTEYGMLAFEGNQSMLPSKTIHRIASVKHTVSEPQSCPLCASDHALNSCPSFKKLDVADRWKALKDHKRCFRCLKANHRVRECKSNMVCLVSGCGKWHHTLLHSSNRAKSPRRDETSHVCTSYGLQSSTIQLGFVPVKLHGPTGTVSTYAFLDNGSDCTIIDRTIAGQLGLELDKTSLRISTLHGVKSVPCSKSKATLTSVDETFACELDPLIVVDQLPVDRVDKSPLDPSRWPHLEGVTLHNLPSDRVGLLIGCDIPKVHSVIDQRIGTGKQPFAIKSVLGWVVRGPMGLRNDSALRVHAISTSREPIEALLVRLYESEFQDIGDPEELQQSVEDTKAVDTVAASVKLTEGHYQLTVPWKGNQRDLPDNRQMALGRLENLRRKLLKDEKLRSRYVHVMNEHLEKGHVSLGSPKSPRWFLPHHPVINPKKPEKLRIVFDCAAKCRGLSLNDVLLPGPDLINNMTGVLLRFRLYRVALSADIREMFLQVRLPEEDKWAFSFLWWSGNNLNNSPEAYEWNVHPFGATSSPFCANYALRQAIEDNTTRFPSLSSELLKKSFYVDDFLLSTKTISEAKNVVRDLPPLLSRGGFDLVKWNSNSAAVLNSIDPTLRSHSVEELPFSDSSQRTLGVKWHMAKDVFMFELKTPLNEPTRRTLLAYLASIYDPCGFIAPVLLPGKLLLQELCRLNVGWDTELKYATLHRYQEWLETLKKIPTLEINRCLIPDSDTDERFELHLFSDASEIGYGAVAYLRRTTSDGEIHCPFLIGKGRVAPLQFISIPRLELTAALLAARLSAYLVRELNLTVRQIVFWTDSVLVLRYLSSTSARLATFVANRVRRIRELSNVSQWRYVPTKDNPADLASRGLTTKSFCKIKFWLEGTQYLRMKEASWPTMPTSLNVKDDQLETKKVAMIATGSDGLCWLNELATRCPSWTSLQRHVVWLIRFQNYIRIKLLSRTDLSLQLGKIKTYELSQAIRDIIRMMQIECFNTSSLASGRSRAHQPHDLRKLKPIYIDGVLCLGGRVQGCEPLPILPSTGRMTSLIIRHYHEVSGHAGPTHVLASVRREYWIIKGMATVRRVLRDCAKCRLLHAPPCEQAMAPLPRFRTESESYPFSHTGLDYFGPFLVKYNRITVKRFGCLFTCMHTRAIHIEVAHSMTTDSFLMAVNRFISRRGTPKALYSDNGSNFIGAEAELRSLCQSLDDENIHNAMLTRQIDWHFNPPLASHRGGVWERMIRTVRRIYSHLVKEQTVTDEVLLTYLAETERIVNDRPLVPVYDDPEQPAALCPNDWLILRPNTGLENDEIPLRERLTKQWRQAQHLANMFWKRWRTEYLSILQSTQKWLTPHRNLKVGDLVLVNKLNTPKGCWPKGVVTEAYPGVDGLVRQVLVKTARGLVRRDVRSLCLLEAACE